MGETTSFLLHILERYSFFHLVGNLFRSLQYLEYYFLPSPKAAPDINPREPSRFFLFIENNLELSSCNCSFKCKWCNLDFNGSTICNKLYHPIKFDTILLRFYLKNVKQVIKIIKNLLLFQSHVSCFTRMKDELLLFFIFS